MQRAPKMATVTYHAPEGDSKVVEAFGLTFYDGKPEQVEVEGGLLRKIMGNAHFEVVEGEAPPPVEEGSGEPASASKAGEPHPKDHKDHKDHKGR
jgi:hypothetical protein